MSGLITRFKNEESDVFLSPAAQKEEIHFIVMAVMCLELSRIFHINECTHY